jgi:hypothetical protein
LREFSAATASDSSTSSRTAAGVFFTTTFGFVTPTAI